MRPPFWMSQNGDLDILVTQFQESVGPICSNKAPLNEETCLYAISSYLEHFLYGCKGCLCDLRYVLCIHGRFFSRRAAQTMVIG